MRIFYMFVDSRHLETLVWVARLGGIGAAAQHLNLTQPAITRRIQELERELGARVLRREGRNVVPTPLGQICLGNAERILSEVANMRVAASGNAAIGTIRVGVVESIALTWFQNWLTRIEERYPKVSVGSCAMKWLGHPKLSPKDREMTAADLAALPIIDVRQRTKFLG